MGIKDKIAAAAMGPEGIAFEAIAEKAKAKLGEASASAAKATKESAKQAAAWSKQKAKDVGNYAVDSGKAAALTAGGAVVGAGAAALGAGGDILTAGSRDKPWWNTGTTFVLLAFLLNMWYDYQVGFAGFDFARYGSINSFSAFSSNFMNYYVTFKGPLIVLLTFVGAFILGKRHVAMKLVLSIFGVIFLLSNLPLVAQPYLAMGSFDVIIFVIMSLYLLKNPSRQAYYSMIYFWVPLYAIFGIGSATGSMSVRLHVIFIALFAFFCARRWTNGNMTPFLILLIFDFTFAFFFSSLPPIGTFSFAAIPVLFFGVIFMAQEHAPSKLGGFALFLVIMWLVVFIGFGALTAMAQDGIAIGDFELTKDEMDDRFTFFQWGKWWDTFNAEINRSIAIASGKYEGTVDENAKRRLGVFLEDVDRNDKVFYADEEVLLLATITAENLQDPERPQAYDAITITSRCYAGEEDDDDFKEGVIYPRDRFRVDVYDREPIECDLGLLEEGSHEITIEATFSFITQAYLKRYFVAKEQILSLRRRALIDRPEDVLRLERISDTMPITQNSFAPVILRAHERLPILFELDSSEDLSALLGIRLENVWDGAIKDVTEIELYLPEGIELDRCNPLKMREDALTDPLFEGYRLYRLESQVRNNPKLTDIEDALDQNCWINISSKNNNLLIGESIVSTRYLRMAAAYEYTIKETHRIRVREVPT